MCNFTCIHSTLDEDETPSPIYIFPRAEIMEWRQGETKREQKDGDEFEFGPRLVNFSPRVTALFARGKECVYCPQLETKVDGFPLRVFLFSLSLFLSFFLFLFECTRLVQSWISSSILVLMILIYNKLRVRVYICKDRDSK